MKMIYLSILTKSESFQNESSSFFNHFLYIIFSKIVFEIQFTSNTAMIVISLNL
jgi:hypothetical protein